MRIEHVASPTVDLVVRRCGAGRVVVRMTGEPGRSDVEILRRTLDAELDAAPALLLVELDRAVSTPAEREVLTAARGRARDTGCGLRVVVAGQAGRPAQEITDGLRPAV